MKTWVKTACGRFRKKEEGAALVEYGLLVALIAMACVVGLTTIGNDLSNTFKGISNTIKNQPASAH